MNLRQGKIGGQEALCAGAIAACASSIFTPDSAAYYSNGNSAYVSMLFSAILAMLVFFIVARSMRAVGINSLWELLRRGLGGILARVAVVMYTLLLALMAAALLSRFTLMLGRFVFPLSPEWQILLYMLAAAIIPAWLGFESLGRVSRLLVWLLLLSMLGALALGVHNYEPHRLAPYLGDGTLSLIDLSVRGVMLFLPALLGLLIAANGVHGPRMAQRAGLAAGAISGTLSALAQLCLGMTYSYRDLAEMHSPMYRLTMGYKTGGYFPRLDLMLLFGWVVSGMLGAAFYIYVAALLYAQAFGYRDIRPSVAVFSGCVGALALLLHMEVAALEAIVQFLSKAGYLLMAIPVLLAALIAPSSVRGGHVGREREEAAI